MAAPSLLSLKEYLKRYQSGTDEPKEAKKKKNKEKPEPASIGGGVIVVDNDPIWQNLVPLENIEEKDNFGGVIGMLDTCRTLHVSSYSGAGLFRSICGQDDPELEKMLKERLRWGDPMAHLVKGKASELTLEDLSKNEKMKESGFIIPQTIPSHSWLKWGLDFSPNRYEIRPDRHWDGVYRSNGYEKELFKR